jgi:hypothetical protein
MGVQFTWQLKTFMNAETRIAGSAPRPKLVSDVTSWINDVILSAGNITSPGG